jgi:hypothetical protein
MTRKIHPSITSARVLAAVEADEYLGLCLHCGTDHDGIEPDAERYTCEACDTPRVYGAEQILLMGSYHR